MSKNWKEDASNAPKPQLLTDGMSDTESLEYLRGLKPEPQYEPRPQTLKPTNREDFADSRAMGEFYRNNPGHQQPPQKGESDLSKQIEAHQNAIKKRDEAIALRKKQEELEQKNKQEQQDKLDYENRIQTAHLYKMEKPRIRDYCLVKIGDKKQQTVQHGVIWKIEKKWYGSKKYTVKLKDGTVVEVDNVYSLYKSGGRRRKSKKLCNKLKSRKSRRSSQSKSNNRRSRGSFCR
jgi:hypothetical protein